MRLAGHGLLHEGRPVLVDGCCGNALTHRARNLYDQEGHGVCSCGQLSPHESATRARQAWHRNHKDEIRKRDRS